ncbi:MAG: thiamine pyrophosphate-dependent enzyme, partial [Victivallales bacterium]|nr:thiamine pyrophosphate-dependent enzyme [Victivallales bacterium]
LFTVAYSGTDGGLVIVTADDPGMASSQNEQDNRRYAVAAGVTMLEPTDSQEAYDLTIKAFEISEQWRVPVLLRVTTRICHSKCIVTRRRDLPAAPAIGFERDIQSRVMVPAFARIAHRKLRRKLAEIQAYGETAMTTETPGRNRTLGIIASGISYQHCRDAAPDAGILKVNMPYPTPVEAMRKFAAAYDRCVVVEEGDYFLWEAARIAGIPAENKPEMYRFGELNVTRIRRILAGDTTPEAEPPKGKPPQLCIGCPHRKSYELLRDLGCIVSGDIGCYTLGVMPPFQAIDTCVCMGASIGVGLGLRHTLPEKQARKVVSVIGDSTFMHSGLTGIAEMVYNRPATGHLVIVLDNSTTAMTGLQEHPGTGRKLDHSVAPQVIIEDVIRAMGVDHVDVIDPNRQDELKALIEQRLAANDTAVIIARRPCLLAAVKIKSYSRAQA